MSEALLLSVIEKLEDRPNEDETNVDKRDEDETMLAFINETMERIIKEMREIVDVVRDKKLEDGRTLNFLVCDLVDVADDALHLFEQRKTTGIYYINDYKFIHSWMGEIKKQMLKLGDDGVEMEYSSMKSSENVEEVVGLEEDVEILIHTMIVGGGGFRKIVLIKGMAGIGKTTLAREIYNHPTVVEHFETRAWVSSSTQFTIKELLIKLIQQVHPHTSSLLENMDSQSLRVMLRQHLQGTRYLIGFDDVPKPMHLTSFLRALPQEWNGSRLLLTSHTTDGHICSW